MAHRPPRKVTPEPPVVADTFVADGATDNPEYALAQAAPAGGAAAGSPSEPPLPGPRDVPYLPTDQHVVNKMMEMAKVTHGDVLYDLGCGDGRICITAAKLGARAVGVEIDLARLRDCHDNLRNTQLRDRVEFRRQSFFDVDLRPATVVALYLLPAINRLLRPKLLFELRPGSRIVANYFEIADWVPDELVVFKHRPVMLWIVPAWVEGRWRCGFRVTEGEHEGAGFHVDQRLERTFQFLRGSAACRNRSGRRLIPLAEGRVRGREVRLTYPDLPGLRGPVELAATYDDGAALHTTATLRGTFRSSAGARGVWWGSRIEGAPSTTSPVAR